MTALLMPGHFDERGSIVVPAAAFIKSQAYIPLTLSRYFPLRLYDPLMMVYLQIGPFY